MSENQSLQQVRIYRTNKDNKGFASSWQLSYKPQNKYDQYMLFFVMAPQVGADNKGNAKYDWENSSINVKLGVFELGEIISVLDGRKDGVGRDGKLFHQTENGNKILNLTYSTEKGYAISVSSQDKDKNKTGPYYQNLTEGEAVVLSTMLKRAIERIIGW